MRREAALPVVLSVVAGYVDAVGFLRLKHLFVSFMSGNSTQFAISASQSAWRNAGESGTILLIFVIGVMAGRALCYGRQGPRRSVIMGLEAAFLAAASLSNLPEPIAISAMTFAMGLQNAALRAIGKTYVTGTLVGFAEKLTDGLTRHAAFWNFVPEFSVWCAFISGAAFGAFAFEALALQSLAIPCAGLVALSLFWRLLFPPERSALQGS